jgi:O-antigen/teichoic acid export membrane protein
MSPNEPPAHREAEVQEAGDYRKDSHTEPPKTPGRGLLRNAISNWGAFLYVAGISFFLSPYIVSHLGTTAYGIWSLLVALVGYLGLLDFGVRGAVTRYVAHHHALSDAPAASAIASGALVLFGAFGVLAIVIACSAAWFAPQLFHIPPDLEGQASLVIAVGGLTVATTLVASVYGGIITGLQRFDVSSGVEIAITTVRTIGVIVVLKTGHGLIAISLVHLVTAMFYGILMWRATRRYYPQLRIRFDQPLLPHVRTILSYSAFLSAIHVLNMIIYYTDTLVIAMLLPISAVAFFVISANLCEHAARVSGGLSKTMAPRVSELHSVGRSVASDVLSTARLATLAMAPIAVTFLVRGESFINLWMGPEYGPTSGAVLRVLSVMVWLGGARAVAISALVGAGKHRSIVPAVGLEAACNLGLSIVFAHLMGVVGVALGSVIPSVLIAGLVIPIYLQRATGVRVRAFYQQAWLRPTIAVIPFGILTMLFEVYLPAHSLSVFFIQVLAILPLVPLVALKVCATPDEQLAVSGLVQKVLLRLRVGAKVA